MCVKMKCTEKKVEEENQKEVNDMRDRCLRSILFSFSASNERYGFVL